MPGSPRSAVLKSCSAVACAAMRGLWIVLIGFVACIPLVHGQSSTLAALPSAPDAPAAQVRSSIPAIAMPQPRTTWQWGLSPLDPLRPNLGNANTAHGFNSGHMGQAGFNPVGGKDSGSWQGGASIHDSTNIFGLASSGSPSLNQVMRGSWNTPLNAFAGNSRSTFRAPLSPSTNLGDLTHPPTTGLYSTTDLGNGMFLSAGTSFGHSNVGAPAAGMGNNAAGTKRPGPSLGVKLSF